MHVWNVLHAARWKYRTQKIAIRVPSHNFVGLYLQNEGMYRQSEKNLLNSNTSSTCPANMVIFGLLTAEICWRVWGKFQRVSRIGSVTARHFSSGRQPNFAALNLGRHLCSAGWLSRWALAHILVQVRPLSTQPMLQLIQVVDTMLVYPQYAPYAVIYRIWIRRIWLQKVWWNEVWSGLTWIVRWSQQRIDSSVACVKAGGGHFEHRFWVNFILLHKRH